MLLELNLQRFVEGVPDVGGKIIKIKFKNSLTISTANTYTFNFTSNGESFTGIQTKTTNSGTLFFDATGLGAKTPYVGGKWALKDYQIIEVNQSQSGFQAFINAMKNNIDGVELESGTYKWNTALDWTLLSSAIEGRFNFTSNNLPYIRITFGVGAPSSRVVYYWESESGYQTAYRYSDGWDNDAYKTITTTENQYIDYDFYNYAILGNQLVKQTPTPTEITYTVKYYLDGTLVNTSTFTHEEMTGVDYNVVGSVFKVMLSAETLDQYDYGVNLNGETSSASLGSNNIITVEAYQGNITFNITSNGTTTLATKKTYVPSDIDFIVNVPTNVAGVTEITTSSAMDEALVQANVGKYYKYTGTTDDKYTNGDIYQVQDEE